MSEFRLTPEMIGMNNYEYYDPKFCDGNPCPRDCDKCEIKEEILEAMDEVIEPMDDQLEMGFDPYLGCYTDDC
jgi:hypothetical protein